MGESPFQRRGECEVAHWKHCYMLGPMLKFCLCLADLVSMLDCLSMFIMSTILFHIHFHSSWHLFCFGLIGLSWDGMGRTDHGLLPWLSCLHVIRVKISVTTAWVDLCIWPHSLALMCVQNPGFHLIGCWILHHVIPVGVGHQYKFTLVLWSHWYITWLAEGDQVCRIKALFVSLLPCNRYHSGHLVSDLTSTPAP